MNHIRFQRGVTTVEFAIIGAVVMIVLFGVIEVGRAVFAMHTLGEATRRSARFATVCPINDPAIWDVAVFNAPGSGAGARFLPGFQPANLTLEYLTRSGDPIADPVANFNQIYFVRTRVVDYQHQMLIPYLDYVFTTPDFSTTLRRESLGVPRTGAIQPC
jgi:hypothetical protein